MFRLIPVGATLTRAYYQVPGHYGTGDDFDAWDDAVLAARAKHAEIKASVLSGGLSEEWATQCADTQAVVTLRWVMAYPDGGSSDMEVERNPVKNLRCIADFAKR